MSTRAHPLAPDCFYHLYNRGTDKRTIFHSPSDYQRFLELLYLCNSDMSINVRDIHKTYDSVFQFERASALVHVGAFCLMPNHFHMLIKVDVNEGASHFMGKLSTGYSMYFNKKYERSGALFQGSFKSELVDNDKYLKYLYSYIHLNPVKLLQPDWKERGIDQQERAYKYAAEYEYSSLPDYSGSTRPEGKILYPEAFPDYFKDAASHRDELISWLNYQDKENP